MAYVIAGVVSVSAFRRFASCTRLLSNKDPLTSEIEGTERDRKHHPTEDDEDDDGCHGTEKPRQPIFFRMACRARNELAPRTVVLIERNPPSASPDVRFFVVPCEALDRSTLRYFMTETCDGAEERAAMQKLDIPERALRASTDIPLAGGCKTVMRVIPVTAMAYHWRRRGVPHSPSVSWVVWCTWPAPPRKEEEGAEDGPACNDDLVVATTPPPNADHWLSPRDTDIGLFAKLLHLYHEPTTPQPQPSVFQPLQTQAQQRLQQRARPCASLPIRYHARYIPSGYPDRRWCFLGTVSCGCLRLHCTRFEF